MKPSSPFVISETETNQSVYMYKCEGTTVQVLLQLNHRMNILSVLFDLEEHLFWVPNVNDLANPGSAKGVIHTKDVHLFVFFASIEGQAREHGRITHFLPLPLTGHHFLRAIATQRLNRFQIPGYQIKDKTLSFHCTDTIWFALSRGLVTAFCKN